MIRIPGLLAAALVSTLLAAAGVSLQTSHAQAPDGTAVVLTGARLFDGTGRAPLEQSTLVIRNGRIEAVGAATVRSTTSGPRGKFTRSGLPEGG